GGPDPPGRRAHVQGQGAPEAGMSRLLLLSNSTNHGASYLDHALGAILPFLGGARRLVFVPFALRDWTAYTAKARERFVPAGIEVQGLTADSEGGAALEKAEAVF